MYTAFEENFSKLDLYNIREKAENKFKKFASLFRERLFMNLICFSDESGTHDTLGLQKGSEVAAVVGYLSWDTRWKTFCGQWQEVLCRYEVPDFHYSEFMNDENGPKDPNWPYHGWSREKHDRFIRELIPIARNNTIMGIGGLVSVQDYNDIIPDSAKYDHPYHFCFDLFFGAMRLFLRTASNWGYTSPFAPGEKVAFFFDRQDQFKHKALEQYDHAVTHDDDSRWGSITFANRKEDCLPLQAADLLVGRTRLICTRIFKGIEPVNANSWDEDLGTRGNILALYYDAESLKNLVHRVEVKAKIYSE